MTEQPAGQAGPADHPGAGAQDGPVRVTAWLSGRVQGVGMRWWVRSRALELGLAGHAANLVDGRVEVVMEGAAAACEQLLALLDPEALPAPHRPARPGRIRTLTRRDSPARGVPTGFVER